ncbi:MAG: NAD-dependent epimerase/dehydratase family protein [Gammaproteobacteria bacterium]
MTGIDRTKPVLVTGASGYIASWIVQKLLEEGFTVRGTVRSLAQQDRYAHLLKIAASTSGTFIPYQADLLHAGAFDAAVQDCEIVFHTASPFLGSRVKNPERQLIGPAVKGTSNVLAAVNKATTVKKVVLTSSVAAVYGDSAELAETEEGFFTEQHWNRTSSADHQPYFYSKTLAEREAWNMVRAQSRWTLAVINPGFVLGPSLTPRVDSTSIAVLLAYLRGKMAFGVPDLTVGLVDVRDAAAAHLAAAFRPEAEGRHILVAEHGSLLSIAQAIEQNFPRRYKLPKRVLPKALTYLIGPLFGLTWQYLRKNIGNAVAFDNTASKERLGIDYLPFSQTIKDHVEQLESDALV